MPTSTGIPPRAPPTLHCRCCYRCMLPTDPAAASSSSSPAPAPAPATAAANTNPLWGATRRLARLTWPLSRALLLLSPTLLLTVPGRSDPATGGREYQLAATTTKQQQTESTMDHAAAPSRRQSVQKHASTNRDVDGNSRTADAAAPPTLPGTKWNNPVARDTPPAQTRQPGYHRPTKWIEQQHRLQELV